jgi:hypothetical protein
MVNIAGSTCNSEPVDARLRTMRVKMAGSSPCPIILHSLVLQLERNGRQSSRVLSNNPPHYYEE